MPFRIRLIIMTFSLFAIGCAEHSKGGSSLAGALQGDAKQYEKARYRVKTTAGVEFGRGAAESGDIPLLLDLYEPIGDKNNSRPSLLIIHGGSFIRGSRKEKVLVKFATEFASRGYLVASMNYRLSGDAPELSRSTQKLLEASPVGLREAYRGAGINEKAPWAAFEDAQLALQWLHGAKTILGIDSSRIAVLGSSAGALTALKLAYQLDDVASPITAPAAITAIWGSLENDDTSVLDAGESPLLLIHGTADKIVNFNSSLLMYQRAQEVGVPVEFVPLQGRGHGLRNENNNFFTLRVNSGVTVFEKIVAFNNSALFTLDNLALVNCDAVGDACP